MPWFQSPPTHPTYGWHWTMAHTNPNRLTADNHHQPTWTRLNPTSETVRPSESDGIAPHPLECQQAIAR